MNVEKAIKKSAKKKIGNYGKRKLNRRKEEWSEAATLDAEAEGMRRSHERETLSLISR